jgi:hypothetical protein
MYIRVFAKKPSHFRRSTGAASRRRRHFSAPPEGKNSRLDKIGRLRYFQNTPLPTTDRGTIFFPRDPKEEVT